MTRVDVLLRRRLYLDANVFIYGVEGVEPYAGVSAALVRAAVEGEAEAYTSEVTLAGCLVGPLRAGDARGIAAFEDLFAPGGGLTLVPVSRAVLVEAARLRAATRLKLPDAIHAATARRAGCEAFVTNDDRLGPVPGVGVVRLAEVVGG